MSRRRESYTPYVPPSADDLARITFGTQAVRDEADRTIAPDGPTLEEEWGRAFADALVYGVFLVVLAASTPFVLLALAWWSR